MDKQRTGSVLYVTDSPVANIAGFAHAQAYALDQNLPFAVVYCQAIQSPDKQLQRIGEFRQLEVFLRRYSIPLMILIGSRDKVLPWMSGHVKPVKIFAGAGAPDGGELRKHPIAWPGRVMTVPELQALVSGDQSYCRPS
jgi:hypothetical protein